MKSFLARNAGLVAIYHLLLLMVAIAVFADPAVSTFDLQRRDRLPAPAPFIEYTNRFFVGVPLDPDARARYEQLYVDRGGEAVAQAILSSPAAASRELPPALGPDAVSLDSSSLARRYVALYDAGALPRERTADGLGRLGFLALLVVVLLAAFWLDRRSRQDLHHSEATRTPVYLPRAAIVGMFSMLAGMWWLNGQLTLDMFVPGRFGYIEWLSRAADMAFQRGAASVWIPYPQGTQGLVLLLRGLSDSLSGLVTSDLWTSFTIFRVLFECCFLLAPSIALVWLMYDLGATFSPASATVAAGSLAFSFATIYYGVAMAYVTDPLAVLCAAAGVLLLVRGRLGLAGFAIGLGSVLKLIPLVLLPVLRCAPGDRRARLRGVLAVASVHLVVLGPFAFANWDVFSSPLRWQSGRPAWESWYAFANWTVNAPHEYLQPYFLDASVGSAFGWVFTGITPRLTALLSAVPSGPPRWESLVSVLGTLGMLACVVGARNGSPRALMRWALYCVCVVFMWSAGWSPQYELYLVPFVLLAFEQLWIGAVAALLLQLVVFLEYPLLLPWAYFFGGSVVWLAWGAILSKYILFVWFAAFVLRTEWSLALMAHRLEAVRGLQVRRLVPSSVAIGPIVLGVMILLSACAPPAPPTPSASVAATASPRAPGAPTANATPVSLRLFETPQPAATPELLAAGPGCSVRRLPAGLGPAASPGGKAIPGGWFFTEAADGISHGFGIRDDDQAAMWSAFQKLGGWPVLGYPVSRRFSWHGRLSQATQRSVLQWSPKTGEVEAASVFDLLHEDGRDGELLSRKQIPPLVDVPELGLPYETIAARRLAWLDERPPIKARYCAAPGGADAVAFWGLPTSPAVDVSGDGSVYVLRTQNAAFQESVHPAPWAAAGEVTVVLAGDLGKEFNLLPAEALDPELLPAQ